MAKKKSLNKSQCGRLGGLSRTDGSLRGLIRDRLLSLMTRRQPSFGSVGEVEADVEGVGGFNPLTLPVQVSQVRNQLLEKAGVTWERRRGGLTSQAKADIMRQLRKVSVQRKLTAMKEAA